MTQNVRLDVGKLSITVLTDGATEFEPEQFLNTSEDEIDTILAACHADAIQTNFNAFLIEGGDGITLVDAGVRDLFGPVAGHLPETLAKAGVRPDEITRLVFTHMHPDHVAGAITADGAAVFTNAEVVVNEAERDFWADPANVAGKGETLEGWQQVAAAVLSAYGDQVSAVKGAATIASGIEAMPLPGHTPGHMGLRVSDGDAQALIAADIVHAQVLQLTNPEIGIGFDLDPDAARDARKAILDQMASDGVVFTGGHILGPNKFGRVERKGTGYAFVPVT
ncbi:MBL fold metallo-hydrolase [Aliiroseovarius sp. PTFE2010]|uniref:MBL fold metallo-hydrolase n=1 Tax=Aliiroseovarius sp. PTFE2010 TaxID=3417190 RepID=UPI003CEDDB68